MTKLQSDVPTPDDAFGSHELIANELVRIVTSDADPKEQPHFIGLLGDWGSGKSSVVRMADRQLSDPLGGNGRSAVFIYDAWSHGGDELRRAFLDAFCDKIDPERKSSEMQSIREDIWDQTQKTETTSEPKLHRHGAILILSLLLVPIGLRFYNSTPTQPVEVNVLSLLAVFMPVLLAVLLQLVKWSPAKFLQRLLYGTDDRAKLASLSVMSPFLQKVHGQVETKRTTSPIDSINAFNRLFRRICRVAQASGYTRTIVIIDNIDRLDRTQARAFWSTMQSFFDKSSWHADADILKYVYVVAPFSPAAVRNLFTDNDQKQIEDSSQSFIDKTFDLSINVPPPIQINLRRYLLERLKYSFPEHRPETLECVRDLYDYHRAGETAVGQVGDAHATRRTPREMKLFVNQLVALYRVRGDDAPLEVMAAYVLTKRRIDDEGIQPKAQLSSLQLEMLPRIGDLVQQLAAVHFGVSVDDAAQVTLATPIREALLKQDQLKLKQLAASAGFADVLKIVISEFGRDTSVAMLCRIIDLTMDLSDTSQPWGAVWSALFAKMQGTNLLGAVPSDRSTRLKQFRDKLYPTQQQDLGRLIHTGLSGRWTKSLASIPSGEEDNARTSRLIQSSSIVELVLALVQIDALSELGDVSVELSADGYVALAYYLSAIPNKADVLNRLRVRVSHGKIEQALRHGVKGSKGSTRPYDLVLTLKSLLGSEYDWSAAVSSLRDAFVEDAKADISRTDALHFLMAIGTQVPKSGAAAAIATLASDGSFGEALVADAENSFLAAAVIASILGYAPSISPQSLASSARRADKNFEVVPEIWTGC